MSVTRRTMLVGAAAALAELPAGAQDNWPQRLIRIIIPTAPGGSPDIAARLLGDKITASGRPAVRGGKPN